MKNADSKPLTSMLVAQRVSLASTLYPLPPSPASISCEYFNKTHFASQLDCSATDASLSLTLTYLSLSLRLPPPFL